MQGTTGNGVHEGVTLRRWARDWYPGLPQASTGSFAIRGIPAVVASTPAPVPVYGQAPAPNFTAVMGAAPSAQSYPVRNPLLLGEPLPPATR